MTDKQMQPAAPLPPEDDIDEVYDRIYMSGQPAAACLDTMKKCGITHIVRVTPYATKQHANIKYLVFDKIFDDSE